MKDFLFRNYKWYVAGLWVLLALTISVEAIAYYNSAEAVLYILFTFLFCYPVVTILSERLLPKALKKKNVKAFLWHMTTFTLLLAFFFALNEAMFVWFENHAVFPPSKAFTGWNGDKPFYLIFFGRLLTAFMINAVFCALRFFNEHYRMSREHAKLQQAHLEDELRLLRSQINPHMMFNVLNHIHILMKKNVERSDELLMRYSDALRYQLYECNQETVSLGKEVDYLKDIVEVEKMRWGNELKVDCRWSVENPDTEISPLLLIPFVENAFKHVSRLPSETGYIDIALNQNGNTLRLVVENSRTDRAPQRKNASGIGLENIRKQLEILYHGKHELVVQKTATVYKIMLIITL